ncbi:MAG: RsmE family RNA methyltransferase, partial [Chloroflexota bacterium]
MAAKAQPRPHPLPRFFVSPDQFGNGRVDLPLEVTQQLQQVLRRKAGDSIIVLDNSGWEYEVELLHLSRRDGEGEIKQKRLALPEPKLKLYLYPALLKGEKLEWLLQKGTELGIGGFCPVICQRSLLKEVSPAKIERWQRIIQEAAEQSGRGRLPSLASPISFERAWEGIEGPGIIPWEGEAVLGLKAALEKVTLNGSP